MTPALLAERIALLEIDAIYRLAKFGRLVLDEHRSELGDLDGGWLQDQAEACGVLVRVLVTERCGDGCRCVEYGDFPMECLREPE